MQNHEKQKEAIVVPKETIKEKCRACGKEFTPFSVIDERGRRYMSTVCEECAKKYAQ